MKIKEKKYQYFVLPLSLFLSLLYGVFILYFSGVELLLVFGFSFGFLFLLFIFLSDLNSMFFGSGEFSYIPPTLDADKNKDDPDTYLLKQSLFFIFYFIVIVSFIFAPFRQ